MLSLCEKSLQVYLKTKRRAFPRFYFLSAADLVNILLEGANPHAIMHNMPNLFDNVKTFIFKKKEGKEYDDKRNKYNEEKKEGDDDFCD
jgi:dynein heavy chain